MLHKAGCQERSMFDLHDADSSREIESAQVEKQLQIHGFYAEALRLSSYVWPVRSGIVQAFGVQAETSGKTLNKKATRWSFAGASFCLKFAWRLPVRSWHQHDASKGVLAVTQSMSIPESPIHGRPTQLIGRCARRSLRNGIMRGAKRFSASSGG